MNPHTSRPNPSHSPSLLPILFLLLCLLLLPLPYQSHVSAEPAPSPSPVPIPALFHPPFPENKDSTSGDSRYSSASNIALALSSSARRHLFKDPSFAAERAKPEGFEDLELLDIVLITSVNGDLHAIERSTGRKLWRRGGVVSIGGTSTAEDGHTEKIGSGLVESKYNASHGQPRYIIEPHDGSLFVFVENDSAETSSGAGAGELQKLPITLEELIHLSPFTFPHDPSHVFIGSKTTSLLSIDIQTGLEVSRLGVGKGERGEDVCKARVRRRKEMGLGGGKEEEEEECEMDIEERPEDLLFLGQTEYHLVIRTQSGDLIQSLSHTRLIPNSIHRDLSTYWSQSAHIKGEVFVRPGRKYGGYTGTFNANAGMGKDRVEFENRWRVEMMHDGNVAGIEQGRGLRWVTKLEDIAISAYDVLLPATSGSKPILLPQPAAHLPTLFPDASNNIQLMSLPASTYVHQSRVADTANTPANPADGSTTAIPDEDDPQSLRVQNYFAMSSANYPLIGYAPRAKQGGLIGGHLVHDAVKERLPALIDPPSGGETDLAIRKSDGVVPSGGGGENYTDQNDSDAARAAWTGMSVMGVVVALIVVGVMMAAAYRYPKLTQGVEKGEVNGQVGERTALLAKEVVPAGEHGTLNGNGHAMGLSVDKELPSIPPEHNGSVEKDVPEAVPISASSPSETLTNGHSPQDRSAVREKIVIIKKTNGRRRKRGKKGKGKKGEIMEEGDDEDDNGDVTETEAADESGPKGEMPTEASPEEEKEENQPAVVKAEHQIAQVDGLSVSDDVIGFGSHGTVVYRGVFQGRAVAVKRLLRDFVSVASQEVALLQASDDHQNVIRYFYQEKRDNFLYIALELCSASLSDVIERPQDYQDLTVGFDRKKALYQITAGLKHLHGLKIIHRDLKPQNVLVSVNKKGTQRMLLSDFGLAKRLDHGQSSYAQTANHAVGSVGWRAPECLRGEVQLDDLFEDSSHSSLGNGSRNSADGPDGAKSRHGRLTKAVDLFALGCVYFYVLTNGCHPYGDRYEREVNIVRDHKVGLEKLDSYGEDGYEAKCLIEKLLTATSSDRPDSNYCLIHPFFWSVGRRLAFLCDASDRFEIMELQPPEPTLVLLESKAMSVIGQSWQKRLDSVFLENLGKHRKYDSRSLRDLLRAMRNKKHHYQDLPDNVKRRLGSLPAGFLNYFTSRFPTLFSHVHEVIQDSKLRHESMFVSYFDVDD